MHTDNTIGNVFKVVNNISGFVSDETIYIRNQVEYSYKHAEEVLYVDESNH